MSCAQGFRNTGIDWNRVENGEGNVFYETDLGYGEKTELFFKNTIAPPDRGIACLDFKYRKFSKGKYRCHKYIYYFSEKFQTGIEI